MNRIVIALLLLCLQDPHAAAQGVGDFLSPHTAGGMDIHHINTGEGNAAFFIFPDGTTMLFDCGDGRDIKRAPNFKSPPRPDATRSPADWIARYIRKYHPGGPNAGVDYLVISHFHSDHMGAVPELGRQIKFHRILDRAWPDYQKTTPFTGEFAERYKAALKDQTERHGANVEQFKAGASDQIVLLKEPAKFPEFEVRNLAANGEIWTGNGTESRQRMPANYVPNENCSSIAMRIRYGAFDYFSGGDLPGVPAGEVSRKTPLTSTRRPPPEWLDMESPVAWVTGPVDVLVLNHHGGQDTTNASFLSVLQPRVHIAQVWDSIQVTAEVLRRIRSESIYPGPRDVFTTNGMWEGKLEHMIEFYGEEIALRHAEDLKNVTASQGHIVVRVEPGGARYNVFVLDDSEESFKIRSVHGKHEAR
jgi:hypothetical protein